MKFLAILVLSVFNFTALGWWDNGHMLTSQIAKHYLKAVNPKVYDRAEEIVFAMNGLDYEIDDQFVTAAVWPDDIKDKAMNFWDQWHFFDRPINPQGNYIIQDISGHDMNAHDLMDRALLEFEKADEDITMQEAIFMRYVLHVVGDIHQPLHAETMFNDTYTYPLGDMGGNLETIIDPTGVSMNLHAFWDQGAEYFQTLDYNRFERPMSQEQIVELEEWAYQLMAQYPTTFFDGQEKNMDFTEWTKESWKAAKEYAYPLVYKSNQLTEDYLLKGQKICKERVTLAGYRLAHFLEKLLQPYFDNIEAKQLQQQQSPSHHVDYHDGMQQESMGRQEIRSFLGKSKN